MAKNRFVTSIEVPGPFYRLTLVGHIANRKFKKDPVISPPVTLALV